MADHILIATAFLDTLHTNARDAAYGLRECSDVINSGFAPNHEVTRAYDEFIGRWKKNRQSLQEGLDAVAQALAVTRDTFMRVDSELAGAVRGQKARSS